MEFLGRYGYSCPADLEKAVAGMSFSETAGYFKERFSLPLSLEEIKSCWIQMAIGKYRNEVPLKPGALEFLKYCKQNGILTGIATSNSREIVDAVIEALGIDVYKRQLRVSSGPGLTTRKRDCVWLFLARLTMKSWIWRSWPVNWPQGLRLSLIHI